ncbi:hypothetical protein [Pseudalkalibacillus berkeleyi]|uniref:Lipoprotein n=1 Tax=Pseudalkalibacillus berkeleyi TaxID=1069813 RepID=A0ABS9H369_9BACL|nr:hypothetical protein [Pseudalkalibacillus berkeleyi]MCF6138292.1 hypothetical protein [Pseudalkalibacillus berkeleyi]
MSKSIKFFGIFMLFVLIACSNQSEAVFTDDIQTKIKDHIGFDVSFPDIDNYKVNNISLEYPPEINPGEPNGDRHVVLVSYAGELGEKLETKHDEQQQEYIYGPYEGKPNINVSVSNFKNSMNNSKVRDMNGVTVEYIEKKQNNNHILSSSFNVKNGSFQMNFHLDENFKINDAWNYVEKIVKENK